MKFKLLTVLFIAFSAHSASAQSTVFSEGDVDLYAGLGLGSTLYSGGLYSTTLPAISFGGDYGILNDVFTSDLNLSIGGYMGFAGSEYKTSDGLGNSYGWKYNYTVIGARGALHYTFVENLDTYAGLMLGVNIVSAREFGNIPAFGIEASSTGAVLAGYVGARYFFNSNWAAMGELGYGVAWLTLGAAYKL